LEAQFVALIDVAQLLKLNWPFELPHAIWSLRLRW
jgi:hypothetical protein